MDYANSIATKGVLGDMLPTKGFVILLVEETIIRPRRGVGVQGRKGQVPRDFFKKKIKIKYIYNNKVYIQTKIVRVNQKIDLNNIDIEIIDNKPKLILKIIENNDK